MRVRSPIGGLSFPYRAGTTPAGVDPAPSRGRLGADYDTDWARRPSARVARAAMVEGVMRPVVAALAAPRRRGADRLDDLDGPVLFAANHHSHVDTPVLLTSIPVRFRRQLIVGAAADYFFGNHVTGAISALTIGAIPIERTKVGRKSADLAAELIDDGHSMLLYPEGGRSPDGWGQPFRGGAAYLAARCSVPVVPVHIEGTGRILPKGRNRPKPAVTTVTFGHPLSPTEDERSARFAARLEAAVAELADEASSDWYSARQRAHAGSTPSLHGPDAGAWRRVWALGDRDSRRRRAKRRWPEL
ncbi:MAG: lysophospholipid acyltransferase family protein [Acidimicrobiales bacterium]